MRTEGYRVELLDLTGTYDRTLQALPGGDITVSRQADICRTASVPVLDTDVPWEQSLVRITYESNKFSRTLITGYPSVGIATTKSGDLVTSIQIFDTTDALWSASTQITFGVAEGTNIISRVRSIIEDISPLAEVLIPPSSAVLSAAVVWDTGTPWLVIVNDLLATAGYQKLMADGEGVLRSDEIIPDSQKPNSFTFEDDESSFIAAEGVSRSTNRADIPNRIRGIRTPVSPDAPADVYIATNTDPASPFSYASRGYRWIDGPVMSDVDAADYDVFSTLVKQELDRRTRISATFEFSHPVLRYDVGDVVSFHHSKLTERSIRCSVEELRYTMKPGTMVKGRYAI